MGGFNVLVRSNYLYMKFYLKDEYDNAYMQEEAINQEAI